MLETVEAFLATTFVVTASAVARAVVVAGAFVATAGVATVFVATDVVAGVFEAVAPAARVFAESATVVLPVVGTSLAATGCAGATAVRKDDFTQPDLPSAATGVQPSICTPRRLMRLSAGSTPSES